MLKRAFLLLLPAAVVTAPVAWYSGPQWFSKVTTAASGPPSPAEAAPPEPAPAGQTPSPVPAGPARDPLEAPPVVSLDEVFRFDVTPAWVMRRWPRVTSGLSELPLQGYRVSLVTGTAEHDLAGALTYYFNSRQQVQRITFHGTTGDARRLIRYLAARHKFARRLTNDPGVWVYEVSHRRGEPQSVLEVRPMGVVRSDQPLDRYRVDLRIERPAT